ncbi:MAG: aspartate--tRNA ligase [Lentisphaeria bacterium]|nr:aspartate--tRNA ligase [Lentisphaeria bacterium]NQZ70898.1 aspartate--tRNA ligase [Lentisphaeria bacterium]
MHAYRTHTCGELRDHQIGQTAKLSGWVHTIRDHGGVCFIDLRDHYGITQVVVHPEVEFFQAARQLHFEYVVCFEGEVVRRDDETINKKLPSGLIELKVTSMEVLSQADQVPFPVHGDFPAPEATRLKYRYLDLRKEDLHRNIILRSEIIASIRQRMTGHDFNEIQTPILTASSPEGARDYLVPSRLHPGQFYALPQAPQQFKQLLMVAGFDKYFQIAPCFRDEDARADRSPGEFYQLDMEMSFATQDDVFEIIEDVIGGLFSEFANGKTVDTGAFVRIAYKEAMQEFGCDKPDLRNPLRLMDVTSIFDGSDFKAFAGVVERGGVVRATVVRGIADRPRKFYDEMIEFAQSVGAKGLGYIVWKDGEGKSPIANYMDDARMGSLVEAGSIEDGDVMFFIADTESNACSIGSEVLKELGNRLELLEENCFRFCWIVDYPMYEYDERNKEIIFSHNPFSMPQGGMDALMNEETLDILAYQYDLVCNGIELSSGAIRNHKPEIMYKAFEIGGYDSAEVDKRFGGMISAFKHGAPPHGGIAPGIDRIVMLLSDSPNIREVIAFPFNQQAQDLMMNAPNDVSRKQLKELHIKVDIPKGMQ